VGARNHIGFSGVFLTDDHKAVARRKKARRSMTRQAGSARELEQLMMHHPREDEESSRHASPSWAQHREHAPSSASPPSSSSQLWQPSHHSSNDTSRSNVKKAASVDSNGPCTADLDAALKELHFREYDLNGVVRLKLFGNCFLTWCVWRIRSLCFFTILPMKMLSFSVLSLIDSPQLNFNLRWKECESLTTCGQKRYWQKQPN